MRSSWELGVIWMATIKLNEVRLRIHGLAGAACARHVENALRTVVGVSSTLVNPVSGHATVVYDPARARLSSLEAAIHRVGCGTARPGRAVLRVRTAEDPQLRAAAAPCIDETALPIGDMSDAVAEAGILQQLISSAMERVGEPDAPVNGSCPGRGASTGATDRLA